MHDEERTPSIDKSPEKIVSWQTSNLAKTFCSSSGEREATRSPKDKIATRMELKRTWRYLSAEK